MKTFHPLLLLIFILGFISCNQSTTESGLSQGIIEYQITYPETGAEIPFKEFLPTSMLFKFKDNKFAFEMSGPMNLVKTSFITDLESKQVLHLIKLMDKKLATTYTAEEVSGIDDYQNLKIQHTGETKEIAGYNCQKAIISFLDDENTSFEIYYTNHLKINSPNWSTPYKAIDGVLMQYRLKRYNLTMDFVAKKVRKAELTTEDFEKPKDYKATSQNEIRTLLIQPF
jgi:GLPGLI family protein